MMEWIVLGVCGLVLGLSSLLVLQYIAGFCLVKISLKHPRDKIAHFLTCLSGVIFFFIIFQKLMLGAIFSHLVPVIIMLMPALAKETLIDREFSLGDMLANVAGIVFGILCIIAF